MFALVDANNFYASCERVFDPKLKNRPVVILSNGDGCVIARSNEAKALGVKMAVPFFQIKELASKKNIAVLSSNYTLYGDFSQRLMATLQSLFPSVEIYSIDEAFLDLRGIDAIERRVFEAKEIIEQWLGLPVSIGIGPTKTLAKVANKLAKDRGIDVYPLKTSEQIDKELAQFSIENVWGVGRQIAKSLRSQGIFTALDLQKVDPRWARQRYTVIGERLVRELNGFPCLEVEEMIPSRKSVQMSRSFSHPIVKLQDMEQAVSTYVSRLAEKLRQQNLYTYGLQVYMRNSSYHKDFHYHALDCQFPQPIHDTQTLIKFALMLTQKLFKKGKAYRKAGVIAYPLTARPFSRQKFLFEDHSHSSLKDETISAVLDQVNQRYGAGTLRYAICGIKPSWAMKADYRSPCYTTRWNEIMVIKS